MAKNNFDDLRSTLMDTFNMVAAQVLDLADTAADTAKTGHQIAKLTMEKRKAETAVQQAYEQLGKLYFDMHKESAEGVFADLCSEIENTQNNILDIEDEISALKEVMGAGMNDIEVEFSEIFDEDPLAAEDADFETVVTGDEPTAEDTAAADETPAEEPKSGDEPQE